MRLCRSFPASHAATEMMEIEKYIRYAPRAVGLKPSATRDEARLRGLERNISSKTISPLRRMTDRTLYSEMQND
jgi:hypothetical protein